MQHKQVRYLFAIFAALALALLLFSVIRQRKAQHTNVALWPCFDPKTMSPVLLDFVNKHPDIVVNVSEHKCDAATDYITSDSNFTETGSDMLRQRSLAKEFFERMGSPDVFPVDAPVAQKLISLGMLKDITEQASPLKKKYTGWEAATTGDRIFALPWLTKKWALFYNKDIMKAAGLDPEKPPVDWDDLLRLSAAAREKGRNVFGYGMVLKDSRDAVIHFLPFVWNAGAGKPEDQDGLRCAAGFYAKLYSNSFIGTAENIQELFLSGNVEFIYTDASFMNTIRKKSPELNFGMTAMPARSEKAWPRYDYGETKFLAVSADSKNPADAFTLAEFLVREQNSEAVFKRHGDFLPAALSFNKPGEAPQSSGPAAGRSIIRLQSYDPEDPGLKNVERSLRTLYKSANQTGVHRDDSCD